jgi:hypothetical protein
MRVRPGLEPRPLRSLRGRRHQPRWRPSPHHPIDASGAVLAKRFVHSMKRDGCKRGIVTLCIGGGQGIALASEMP